MLVVISIEAPYTGLEPFVLPFFMDIPAELDSRCEIHQYEQDVYESLVLQDM